MAKAGGKLPKTVTIENVTNMLGHIESCCRTVRQVLSTMDPGTKLDRRAARNGVNPWEWDCPVPDRPCPDCDCDPCECDEKKPGKGKRKKK